MWSAGNEFLRLYVDGRFEGSKPIAAMENFPTGGKIILAQKSNTLNGDLNTVQMYEGKLSGFNMWDYVMDDEAISVLSLACGAESGNLLQWTDVRDGVVGQINVISPSSCTYVHIIRDVEILVPVNIIFYFSLHQPKLTLYSITTSENDRQVKIFVPFFQVE